MARRISLWHLESPKEGKETQQRTNQRGLLATPNKNGNVKPKRHKALVAAESPEPVPGTPFGWGFAGLKEQTVMGSSYNQARLCNQISSLVHHSKHHRGKATTTRIYLPISQLCIPLTDIEELI